ncbi:hypothetical protein [Pseudomonas sp. S09G 359]|jgi:hypothetical protein|uniref:hypothetical protein n=1 Tax=Pseudomonas sp. S09G 359 TaxID=2054919 RepID=UPI000C6EC8FD|nr:hypothetical protein [Pseudomonas sp. S09G 359]AUG07600.1 hypothetical protein CXQ82_13740 [Pseudomonas sp. S09G 359]
MAQPYAFINERPQTATELKARLDLSKSAAEKFDMLNNHIRNVVVLPGQLVIIGDPTTAMCTPEENRLKQAAWSIRHSVMAEGGADVALQNYDLLQKLLGYASLGVGTAGDAWNRHLADIVKTLEEIQALHKQSLHRGGGAARDEFLSRRRILFSRLEAQMRGFARYGTGLGNDGSIKKMLGISTKSYLQSGEISRYAERIARITRTAKVLKAGTPLGIALSTASTALEIKEACSTGREELCTKTKYVEVRKLTMSVGAGALGGYAASSLCIAVLMPTTGPGSLACFLIGGAAGGVAGGTLGNLGGELVGEKLYEYR